jgi:hypothetical protein
MPRIAKDAAKFNGGGRGRNRDDCAGGKADSGVR